MFKAACLVVVLGLCAAEPPVNTYLPAARGSNRASAGYAPSLRSGGVPSSQYGAPGTGRGLQSNYVGDQHLRSSPSQQYGAPSNGYSSSAYSSYDSESPSGYSAPSTRYGAPSNQNGYSNRAQNSLSRSYGTPSQYSNGDAREGYNYQAPDYYDSSEDIYTSPRTPSAQYGTPSAHSASHYNGASARHSPSSQYGVPAGRSLSPSSQYGVPAGRSLSPSSQYGAPVGRSLSLSSQYGAPSALGRSGPSSQYGAPSAEGRSIPSSQYGTPSAFRSVPSSQYGTPRSSISSPSSQYGTPSAFRSIPSSQYGTPSAFRSSTSHDTSLARNVPSSQYGIPANGFQRYNGYSAASGYGDQGSYNHGRLAGGAGNQLYTGIEEGQQYAGDFTGSEVPANYEFNYDVKEDGLGVEFGQEESRDGEDTNGSYYVLLPDGRRQRVSYTADETGYKPSISYEDTESLINGAGFGRGHFGVDGDFESSGHLSHDHYTSGQYAGQGYPQVESSGNGAIGGYQGDNGYPHHQGVIAARAGPQSGPY